MGLLWFGILKYLFLVALGLLCCAGTTHCGGGRACHCDGFPCWGTQALGALASVVAACRLQGTLASVVVAHVGLVAP